MSGVTGFTINGTDIRNLAYNISTVNGWDVWPGKRRARTIVADRHGVWPDPAQMYNDRMFSLDMVVLPQSVTGAVTHPQGAHGHLQDNIDTLLALFHSDSLLDLRRTMPDGTTRQLYAEVIDAFTIAGGPLVRRFTAILRAPWPFWAELPAETDTEAVSAASHPYTIAVGGNVPVADPVIRFTATAAVTNPRLTVDDTGRYLEYTGVLAITDWVEFDLAARTVTMKNGNPGDAYLTRNDGPWLELPADDATLALTASSTAGTNWSCKIDWKDAWL